MMLFIEKIKNKLKKPESIHIDFLPTKLFDSKNWFHQPSLINLSIENHTIHLQSKTTESAYVNFWESSSSYSRLGERHNKIILHSQNSIFIEGHTTNSLNYQIYLIEYDEENQQTKKHTIQLNQLHQIIPSPSTKAARLAIRINGEGEMEIHNLFTSPFLPVERTEKTSIRHLNNLKFAGALPQSAVTSLNAVTQVTRLYAHNWGKTLAKAVPDFLLLEAGELHEAKWGDIQDRTSPIGRLILWCQTSDIPMILWHKQTEAPCDKLLTRLADFKFVLTHDPVVFNMYKQAPGETPVYLIPYTTGVPSIDVFKKHPSVTVLSETTAEANAESKTETEAQRIQQKPPNKQPITIETIQAANNTEKQIEELLAEGHLVICEKLALDGSIYQSLVRIYETESELEQVIQAYQNNPDQAADDYRSISRTIYWKHNYRDFMHFITKSLHIEHATRLPSATIVFSIRTEQEYQNVIRTIEKQTASRVNWIVFITPYPCFEQAMNALLARDNIQVYIASFAAKNYALDQLTKSTYVGVVDSSREYDAFYIEDCINTMYYFRMTSFVDRSITNNKPVIARFFLTTKYNHHSLVSLMEAFIPKEKVM